MIKKLIILICLLLLPVRANADIINRTWPFISLTGGANGSLDGAISGVSINQDDMAFGTNYNGGVTTFHFYRVEMSGADENSPYVISPDDVGAGVTRWHQLMSANQSLTSGSTPTFLTIIAENWMRSGASGAVNAPDSGTSLEAKYFGTIITHNQSTSTIYGMPPISGVSIVYIKFIEGAAAGGIIVYNVNSEPFMGDGLSGTSYFTLPPGNPFEAATIYSVQTSGTCKYWYVEASSSWVAGN